ncbi:phosphatase PAP2 family protein [Zunongwangia sp. H14]|uniref:phosphatase PAP2 family protein n=1 Tax=Zunongwangia sp. H14 TaxID=3240792 RepID=UPI003569C3B7
MELKLKNFIWVFLFLLCISFTGHSQLIEPKNPTIKTAGDVLAYAIPATTFVSTLILKDKEGTWQMTKGFLLNEAVTLGLKFALNKPRPFHGGDKAFPSGHTSATFQSAAFIHGRYGFKYSIPAYALAGFTAFSRINAQKHDGYDILAGAVVGIGSSLIFTTPYEQEHMDLTFNSYDGQYLLGFTYRF